MSQREIILEHHQVDSGSPSVSYIENYYLRRPERRMKVLEISALSEEQRAHIIRHIDARLRGKRKVVSRKILFAEFISNPAVKQAQTRRFRYFRDKRSNPHKQDKKSGRFAAYSKSERKLIDKQRQLSRQSESKKGGN